MFEPDDFQGRPYAGANNQAMHSVFGAALVSLFQPFLSIPLAYLCGCLLFIAWEIHQLLFRKAITADYLFDIAYWGCGAIGWSFLVGFGWVQDKAIFAPWFVLSVWILEYARIRFMRKNP